VLSSLVLLLLVGLVGLRNVLGGALLLFEALLL
jgi:hypothetical protein